LHAHYSPKEFFVEGFIMQNGREADPYVQLCRNFPIYEWFYIAMLRHERRDFVTEEIYTRRRWIRVVFTVVDEADDSAQFQPWGGLFLAARIVSGHSILFTFPIRVKRNRPPIDTYHLAEAMMTMVHIYMELYEWAAL